MMKALNGNVTFQHVRVSGGYSSLNRPDAPQYFPDTEGAETIA